MSQSAYNTILYDQDEAVVTITFNRPQALNAISDELQEELYAACVRANDDPSCKVVIIKGAGRAFCAGYDLSGLAATRTWPGGLPEGVDVGTLLDQQRASMKRGWRNQLFFGEMDKPVIGQLHGWCIGGGTWYALSMDILVAAESCTIGQPEVRNGDGGSFVWATRVGWSNALRYQLTGDHMDAREALRIGAVNEVVPDDQLDAHVMKLAKRIALLPMESIKLNKAMIRKGMDAMGFRNAQAMCIEIATLVETSWTKANERWDGIMAEKGLRAYLEDRDGPFLPEPFGPRSKMAIFQR
jgi:enoyl-CoA hydratase/carnithine racemase